MTRHALALLAALALAAGTAPGSSAQIDVAGSAEARAAAMARADDPIGRYLYPPEAVLGHAQELELTEAQRQAIRRAVHDMQKRFLDLQLDLEERTETVSRLLQQTPVDEAKVLAAVDQVLALESQVKKAQLSLLVRIKNQLSSAQRAKLDAGLGRRP
jgi:Spy/CpxP family protein refolding chaperone